MPRRPNGSPPIAPIDPERDVIPVAIVMCVRTRRESLDCTWEPLYAQPIIMLIKRALGACGMTEEKEQTPKASVEPKGPRCPTCAAFPDIASRFLDPRTGKTIRLYRCQCGEHVWDD